MVEVRRLGRRRWLRGRMGFSNPLLTRPDAVFDRSHVSEAPNVRAEVHKPAVSVAPATSKAPVVELEHDVEPGEADVVVLVQSKELSNLFGGGTRVCLSRV